MKRAIGFALGLAALAIITGGCATAPGAHARWHTGWEKPGTTNEEFVTDVRACDRAAHRLAAGQPGHLAGRLSGPRTLGPGPMTPLRQAEHERAYGECMRTKGYRATDGAAVGPDALPASALASTARAERVVTVRELFDLRHSLTVERGTAVIWPDSHFARIWFASVGAPAVEPPSEGFRTGFSTAGTYRGVFTTVGGHTGDDIYPVAVTVTEP